MVLTAKTLDLVSGVNNYTTVNQLTILSGLNQNVYFQLVDCSQNPAVRYIPSAGATLAITVWNIDTNLQVTRMANQPYPGDGSIWALPLLSSDPFVGGTPILKFALTEGVQITQFLLQNKVRVLDSKILGDGNADPLANVN